MRKVRLAINVSLDGYVARPNGALDWLYPYLTPAQEEWTTAFLREVDTILIGHVTYRPAQSGEMATLMNAHTKIVFSRRLGNLEWNQSRLATVDAAEDWTGDLIEYVGESAREALFPSRDGRNHHRRSDYLQMAQRGDDQGFTPVNDLRM